MTSSQIPDNIEAVRTLASQLVSDSHPNPLLRRADWMDLEGPWQFRPDPGDEGLAAGWQHTAPFIHTIQVPYAPETEQSGWHADPGRVFWYARTFTVPASWRDRRVVLHFGAVDYEAMVFVNGQLVCTHQGGYSPFSADITAHLQWDRETQVVLRVVDTAEDVAQPRGKQTWQSEPSGILYTRTSGIWQPVWIEPEAYYAIASLTLTPDWASASLGVDITFSEPLPRDRTFRMEAHVTWDGRVIASEALNVQGVDASFSVALKSPDLASSAAMELQRWSPDAPNLYGLSLRLTDADGAQDVVESYFGLRTVSISDDGTLQLNDDPLYLRMVLNQGYFPGGGLTGTDREFQEDILLTKAMGFNGIRIHQKIEAPRFLYWCDRLGLLVWEEMPSAYVFRTRAIDRLTTEWLAVMNRDLGHPAVMAWVPFNESWGVSQLGSNPQQQSYVKALYHLTRAKDASRFVIGNDGWEHVQTDLITVHDYEQDPAVLSRHFQTRAAVEALPLADRALLVSKALAHSNLPILLTEFGGATVARDHTLGENGWGYGTARSNDALSAIFTELIHVIDQSPVLQGYCYTQFTDVQQEQNGLVTIDRVPKIPIPVVRSANLAAKTTEREPD